RSGRVRSLSLAPVRSISGRMFSRPILAARSSPTLLEAIAVDVWLLVWSAIWAMRSAVRPLRASPPPTIDFHHAPTPAAPELFVVSFVPAFALATRSLRLARCDSTDLDEV